MIIYLGIVYIIFGTLILLLPLIYIEFGRPKDLLKAGLNLIVGMSLIIKYKVFDNLDSIILLLITILITFFSVEIFSIRWNQLTDKEKKRLKTFTEFKKNITKFFKAILLGISHFLNLLNIFKFDKDNENITKKKWVRNEKNDNIFSANKNN